METFSMSQYKNKEALYKAKAEYFEARFLELKDLCCDFLFAELNPSFTEFCGQSADNLKVELKNKILEYNED